MSGQLVIEGGPRLATPAATLYETIGAQLGVEYTYEEGAAPASAPGPGLRERVGTLAPAPAKGLYDALAAALLAEIRAFRFDELMSVLEARGVR